MRGQMPFGLREGRDASLSSSRTGLVSADSLNEDYKVYMYFLLMRFYKVIHIEIVYPKSLRTYS